MSQHDNLPVPEAAARDINSFEILRLWVAAGDQHVNLRSGVWEDPFIWGMMLADLARHIVNALEQDIGNAPSDTLQRIRAGFDAELDSPTDRPSAKPVS
jgi:hypothetical protein